VTYIREKFIIAKEKSQSSIHRLIGLRQIWMWACSGIVRKGWSVSGLNVWRRSTYATESFVLLEDQNLI